MNPELVDQLQFHHNRIVEIFSKSTQVHEVFPEILFKELFDSIKFLRNSCSQGCEVQSYIIQLPEICSIIEILWDPNNTIKNFSDGELENIKLLLWQLLANIIVNNSNTQEMIWHKWNGQIKRSLENELTSFTDIQLMILYNLWKKADKLFINKHEILIILLKIWCNILQRKDDTIKTEFLHIFFEDIICNQMRNFQLIKVYDELESKLKILLLKYVVTYLRHQNPNGHVNKLLMEHISKQFKVKSDHLLKYVNNQNEINEIYPEEVLELLDVIATGTGDENYASVYERDQSLFLNVGSLLQILNNLGRDSKKNIFTPMEKLVEVAPNSKISANFENEISFELRTKLVRTLANLSYKNDKNKQYAREMDFIRTILDCMRADARNPMVKEWSILAIRNLCEDSTENQEIISKLSKVADAPNDLLNELNLEMGSLRIKPNE